MTAVTWVTANYLLILYVLASPLSWLGNSRRGRQARLVVRVAAYWVGVPFVAMSLLPDNPGAVVAAIGCAALVHAVRWRDTSLALQRGSADALGRPFYSPEHKRRAVFMAAAAAPSQEAFYRGTAYAGLATVAPVPAVVIATSVAFVAEHVVQDRNQGRWHTRDYLTHGLVGLLAGGLMAFGTGLLVAMLFHALVNIPHLTMTIRTGVLRAERPR